MDGGLAYAIPESGFDAGTDAADNAGTIIDDDVDSQQQQQQQQSFVYFDVRAFESITNGRTKYGKLAPDVASTDFFSWEDSSNKR